MITTLISMSSTVDSDVKKNLQNLNQYGVNQSNIDDSINTNNQFISEQLISIIADINLKTTGLTTLYTIPTGYKFFLSSIIIECTEATSITVPAVLDFGFNDPDYNNIVNNLTLTDFTASGYFWKAQTSENTIIGQPEDVLKVKVSTASTGTSQTAKIYISGLLRAI